MYDGAPSQRPARRQRDAPGAGFDMTAFGVLTAWAVVMTMLTTRLFRWSD